MIARRPSGGDVRGATPAHPLLFPVGHQNASLSQSPQQQLLDQRYIQRLFADGALGGLWLPEPQYLYEDSAGTIPASKEGVCGLWLDGSNGVASSVRRNLLTYSEQLDNSAWNKISESTTVTPNIITAPDGTLSADKLIDTATTNNHLTEQTVTTATNQAYTFSVYVKKSDFDTFMLVAVHVGASGRTSVASFVFTGGVPSLQGALTGLFSSYSITQASEGFYRVSATYTLNGTVTSHRARLHAKQNTSYTGNGVSGTYFWGAQLEVGSSATPYQKIVTGTGDAFVPGNHAYQQTTANKPYLRRTPVSGKYWLDGNTATAAMTATFPSSLGSACTVARANADGVTITPAQTITTTYNLTPPYGYNSAVLIVNRALTASETAVVTRYLKNWVPMLGAELITNGNFDTGVSGWTGSNATLSQNSGRLVVTVSADGGSAAYQRLATSVDSTILFKHHLYSETLNGNPFFILNAYPVYESIISLVPTLGSATPICIRTRSLITDLQLYGSSGGLAGQSHTWESVSARSIL